MHKGIPEVDSTIPSIEGNFSSTQWKEIDKENALISTTGSKGLHEAFCEHEERLLSKLNATSSVCPSISNPLFPSMKSNSCKMNHWINLGRKSFSRYAPG